jgi:hypothetical protein
MLSSNLPASIFAFVCGRSRRGLLLLLRGAAMIATTLAATQTLAGTLAQAQLSPAANFVPANVVVGGNALLTIDITYFAASSVVANLRTNAPLPLVNFALVGLLPISNSCPAAISLSMPNQITMTALPTPTIAPGGSCTIKLNVVATGPSGSAGTFSIPSNSLSVIDTSSGVATSGPLQTLTASAGIIVPPSMTVAVVPAAVLINTPAVVTYTLTNPDTNAAAIASGTINLPGVTVIGAPINSCSTVLSAVTGGYSFSAGFIPASGSCAITFNVQSAIAGVFAFNVAPGDLGSGSGNINSSASTLAVTVPVPAITLLGAPVTFAPQTIATTSPAQTVTLTNSGTANLILNVPTSTGPFAFTTTCPFLTPPIVPGGTCTFTITFTPTVVGAAIGTIDFSSSAPSSPTAIALSGTGSAVAVPGVAITPFPPTPLTFATQTVATISASQNILLTNTGSATLLISGINVMPVNGVFTRISPPPGPADCLATLLPDTQCAIAMVFTPAVAGAAAGNVQIITNATPTTYNVPLNGTGAAAAVGLLAVNNAINFGDQVIGTPSSSQTVFISNVGNAFVFVNGVGLTGPNATDFQSSGICGGLVPGATCTVSVSFNPSTIGLKTAQLSIGSNAQNAATVNSVALSGNGVPLPRSLAVLSATAVGFGNTIFGGAAAPQTILLTNNGTLPLVIQSAITSAEYSQTNNCPANLNPQTSCTISLSFTPFGLGPREGEFVLNSNTADSPNRVLLGGNGCRWFKPPGARLFANICLN